MTDKLLLEPGPDHPITLERTGARVTVTLDGRVIADTQDAITLREASYPPVQYIPLHDVDPDVLEPSELTTYCPYKGDAAYYSLRTGGGDRLVRDAVWHYPSPREAVAGIEGHVAFYPDRVDAIEVHAQA